MCWGDNTYGQIGNNSMTDALTPAAVYTTTTMTPLKDVTSLAVGGGVVALLGAALGWGVVGRRAEA